MRPEGLSHWKISSDSIGNRTRDLPVQSAVPQPTAPPRTPQISLYDFLVFEEVLGFFPITVFFRYPYSSKEILCIFLHLLIHDRRCTILAAGRIFK